MMSWNVKSALSSFCDLRIVEEQKRKKILIDDLMKRKRIKTVAWTRIDRCVFDDNESRSVAARSHMTNLTQKVERRTISAPANF